MSVDTVTARHAAIDIVRVLTGTVANLEAKELITEKAKDTLLLTGTWMIEAIEQAIIESNMHR